MKNVQSIELNNGVNMPLLGFGTFQISDSSLCEQCVYEAIEAGYRMFDTATAYSNEAAVGRAIQSAIKDGIVKREELFVTTKLWIQDAGYDATLMACDHSLKELALDYLDLYLIHHPFGDYYGSWRAMEHLVKEGKVNSIGVCNFSSDRLIDICFNSEMKPVVNQIEIHPFFSQNAAVGTMREYQIQPQAWGPLSEGQRNIFENKQLSKIGLKYGKTAAQVVLRWHIQRGISVIPKTVHKERMVENMDIWDFELSKQDLKTIAEMDIGYSEIINHQSACTAKWLNEWKIHE